MSVLRALRLLTEGLTLIFALMVAVNWALFAIGAPWWTHPIAGGLIGVVVNVCYLRWRMRQHMRNRIVEAVVPEQVWVDTGDPFDPRGDGSLQPGDPLFDHVMAPMMNGQYPDGVMMIAIDGIYEVHPAPKGFGPPTEGSG